MPSPGTKSSDASRPDQNTVGNEAYDHLNQLWECLQKPRNEEASLLHNYEFTCKGKMMFPNPDDSNEDTGGGAAPWFSDEMDWRYGRLLPEDMPRPTHDAKALVEEMQTAAVHLKDDKERSAWTTICTGLTKLYQKATA